MNWVNFVTFQKARLNCSSIGKYRYQFNSMSKLSRKISKIILLDIFTLFYTEECQ